MKNKSYMSSLMYKDNVFIRKQYFNGPIYCLFLIALMVITMTASVALSNGTFSMQEWLDDALEVIDTVAILMAPFLILSLLNRFFFGETICVLNDRGIYYGKEELLWENILSIQYNVTHIGGRSIMRKWFRPAYAEVVCKNEKTRIVSAPLYMLPKVKKFAPHVKIKHDPFLIIYPVLIVIISIVQSAM